MKAVLTDLVEKDVTCVDGERTQESEGASAKVSSILFERSNNIFESRVVLCLPFLFIGHACLRPQNENFLHPPSVERRLNQICVL